MIPFKHGVDRLGELSTAQFINVADVDPGVIVAIRRCLCVAVANLSQLDFSITRALQPVADTPKEDLVVTPYMREDSVQRLVAAKENLKP